MRPCVRPLTNLGSAGRFGEDEKRYLYPTSKEVLREKFAPTVSPPRCICFSLIVVVAW